MFRGTVARRHVYELRTYTLKPDCFAHYIRHTNELFHLRTKHSALCGFWITEMGGQNEVVHIWEYDNLTHRKRVRDALIKDDDWALTYLGVVRPHFMRQENTLMLLDNDKNTKLRAFDNSQGPYYYDLTFADEHKQPSDDIEHCATFTPIIGDLRKKVHLSRATDIDALAKAEDASKIAAQSSKLLFPAPLCTTLRTMWQ